MQPPDIHPARILIVDDSRDATMILSRILQRQGHTVQVADDSLQAIDQVRAFQPDIVLLDLGMPKMNGHEVARRIRLEPDQQKTLIVVISGYGQEADKARSLDAGANHHLVKPIDFDELSAIFRTWSKSR